MLVKIDDMAVCDPTNWNKIAGLIGSQNWFNSIFQTTSTHYKPQTTGPQWGYAYQHVSATVLRMETVDSAC